MSVAKAQAAMTAPQTPPSNLEAQKQGFFEQCDQFGTNAGAGDTSKVGWFQATVEAAWQGYIAPAARRKRGDITAPLSDSEMAYKRFADARQKKAGELGKKLKDAARDNDDWKSRVNEANTMIKLGSLPLIHDNNQGGLGVFNRTLKIIREDDEIKGQVDKLVLDVARRQCAEPDKPLTIDQIKHLLRPDESGTQARVKRTELSMARQAQGRINSMMTAYPKTAGSNEYVKQAYQSLNHVIDALEAAEKNPPPKVVRQGARKGGKKK